MSQTTYEIHNYWNAASCGTDKAASSKYSLEYFEQIESFRYQHEPFIHQFAQFNSWYNQEILEVGVGAGTDFLQFIRGGAKAYGVDLTEESIRNIQHRLDIYGLQAKDLRVCNAEKLPYQDESFDLVYSWGVIHHAENMEQVFSEIYRVAKPRATIKIMVYNLNSTFAWYRFLRHALPHGKIQNGRQWAIYHFQESYATKAYTRDDINQLLKSYPHSDLKFYFWEQLIRSGAKFEKTRRFFQRITPPSMRWYMAFEFKKNSL